MTPSPATKLPVLLEQNPAWWILATVKFPFCNSLYPHPRLI